MSKDWLKQIVDLWIKFSIVWEKEKKITPKEWDDYLSQLLIRWNKQNKIWVKKWLPKTRKLLTTHTEAWHKVYRDMYNSNDKSWVGDVLDLVKAWLISYIKDIKSREDWWYGDHRFTLYEFIKQKNWLRRFIAK